MMNTKRNADAIRQLMRSPVWADDGAVKLYLYCLAMASHNQYCWRGLRLQPGDMPLPERKAAKAFCWSRDKLRRRMRMLEAQGMVTIQSIPNVGTMLHVVNWPVADTAVLKNGPVWLHDGAITEVWDVQDCTGYPWAAQQAWYQDDTSYQSTGIAVRPTDAQDQTSSAQTGTLVRPNPYKKNIYTSSLPGLAIGNVGVAGLGVIDDMLPQHGNLGHAFFRSFDPCGKLVEVSGRFRRFL